jgi:eukaryotic-like serine/threonine-protein kinase
VISDSVDRYPANLGWRAILTVLLCDADRREEARSNFEQLAAGDFAEVPSNHLWISHLVFLAIICHALADSTRAARLYELLRPYADRNVLITRLPLVSPGSASHYLGLLAAAMSRWEDAASHLEAAIRVHERMHALPLLARSRYHYAQALLARGRPDDQRRAEEHLAWARTVARQLGMRRLAVGASGSASGSR